MKVRVPIRTLNKALLIAFGKWISKDTLQWIKRNAVTQVFDLYTETQANQTKSSTHYFQANRTFDRFS